MSLADIGQQSASNWSTDTTDADDRSDDVTVRADGTIEINLEQADVERAEELAQKRNQSYQDGNTFDDNWADDKSGGDIHIQGLLAEIAMEVVYDVPVDESISAAGDGGLDGELEIAGETISYDIKSREYDGPGAALLAKKANVEKRSEHPDVYIAGYVDIDGAHVVIDGWLPFDEFVDEDNLEEARADWLDHHNYDVSVDGLYDPWDPR